MTVKTGSAWAGTFVTLDATGALATPSTGPAGTLYVDGVANGATVTITGSNPYKFAVTLPSLTAGQRVDMYITATISSIATAGIVASAQADTVLVSDVKTETAAILEDTGNTLDGLIKDVPTVSEFEARTKPAADYALEATLTAIKGAGWTTESLKVIRDALTAVQADLDNPSQYKADVSALATTAHLQEVEDKVDTIDTIADAVKAKTDNLPAVPAQAGEYTAAIAAIPTTPLLAANYTAPDNASISAIKAKTDTIPASPAVAGEYTASIAAIQADLDNPNQYKADVSGIPAAVWGYATRTLSSFGTLISDIWSHATRTLSAFGFTVATQSDANVTAIKAKTDNLPAIPAPANEYDAELAAIQADLDNPNQYKADVSNLATTAHVQEVEDKVDAIKLKTDNIPANPATAGEYTASLAAIQADVSGIPDAILTKAIVDTLTVEQVLKVLAAVETGITTGGGTDTIVYTGKDGTVIRLTGVDEDGNRSAVIVIPGA